MIILTRQLTKHAHVKELSSLTRPLHPTTRHWLSLPSRIPMLYPQYKFKPKFGIHTWAKKEPNYQSANLLKTSLELAEEWRCWFIGLAAVRIFLGCIAKRRRKYFQLQLRMLDLHLILTIMVIADNTLLVFLTTNISFSYILSLKRLNPCRLC